MDSIQPTRDLSKMSPKGHWRNGMNTGKLSEAVRMWPTPSARDWKGAPASLETLPSYNARPLNEMVRFWPTPASDRHGLDDGSGSRKLLQKKFESLGQASHNMNTGQLNPTWVEWLMGFPSGWTDLKDLAMPLSPRSSNGSDTESSNTPVGT
jgi:hypothetical protein